MTGNKQAGFVFAFLLVASNARADGPTAADQTLAQTLFDEGVALMDKGRFGDACPKLAESQRLDPGGGTLLNLGYCRQNEGKLASAWAAYNEALSQAIKDGRGDRERAARVHVDELNGKFAKLAVDVTEAARKIDQIDIRIDGTSMRPASWGVLSPIDRGTHAIIVTAPGKLEFKTSINVEQDGTTQRVSIPALVDAPVVAPIDHDRPERRGMSGQALVGWLTGGVGVALVGVGVTTGVLAIDARGKSNNECPLVGGVEHCTSAGVTYNDQAKTYAWFADFGVGLGAAAVITGFILIVTAPKSTRAKSALIVPMISPNGGGAAFTASF